MLNSEEIKPVAIAIIELCLSEGIISKGVSPSQSVENRLNRKILKFHSNFLQWVWNVRKTFLGLEMLNQYCLDVTK